MHIPKVGTEVAIINARNEEKTAGWKQRKHTRILIHPENEKSLSDRCNKTQ
jgi:hypothetical protein